MSLFNKVLGLLVVVGAYKVGKDVQKSKHKNLKGYTKEKLNTFIKDDSELPK